jgi:hypothetical protein
VFAVRRPGSGQLVLVEDPEPHPRPPRLGAVRTVVPQRTPSGRGSCSSRPPVSAREGGQVPRSPVSPRQYAASDRAGRVPCRSTQTSSSSGPGVPGLPWPRSWLGRVCVSRSSTGRRSPATPCRRTSSRPRGCRRSTGSACSIACWGPEHRGSTERGPASRTWSSKRRGRCARVTRAPCCASAAPCWTPSCSTRPGTPGSTCAPGRGSPASWATGIGSAGCACSRATGRPSCGPGS